jgi:hypothetical protein
MRIVSRRGASSSVAAERPQSLESALRDAAILQRTLNRLRPLGFVPRGVYRFESHAEADEWMMLQIARSHAHQSSKIS